VHAVRHGDLLLQLIDDPGGPLLVRLVRLDQAVNFSPQSRNLFFAFDSS
jgi:hypothetical protein